MLEQTLGPVCRVVAAFALLALAACERPVASPVAQLELVAAAARGEICDPALSGALRLQGVDVPGALLISGAELCAGAPLRQDLPSGMYALSWQGATRDAAPSTAEASRLSGPSVMTLLPGRLTRLRVSLEAAPTARVARDVDVELPPQTSCAGHGPSRSGAS